MENDWSTTLKQNLIERVLNECSIGHACGEENEFQIAEIESQGEKIEFTPTTIRYFHSDGYGTTVEVPITKDEFKGIFSAYKHGTFKNKYNVEIEILKDINVFGFEMPKGSFITKINGSTLRIAKYEFPEKEKRHLGHGETWPIFCLKEYNKTANEFIEEINRLNK